MIIQVRLESDSYDIILERGSIRKARELLNLDRRVFIVTDSGVPKEYADIVSNECRLSHVECIPQGESSKSMEMLQKLLNEMKAFDMGRDDCVIAIGGGVVGDISGFAASCYMRGIDFYNIPTTLLSQIDSSIGGKTAINFGNVKNLVGTFYQPKRVMIDVETLSTLSSRLINEGLAEAIKISLTSDEKLFKLLEDSDTPLDLDTIEKIICDAIKTKVEIVEKDEKDLGLRHVLNFGHTIGHAIESKNHGKLLHGECVALGMLPMCFGKVRERLLFVLKKNNLPYEIIDSFDSIRPFLIHDKKKLEDGIMCVLVDDIGSFKIKKLQVEEIENLVLDYWK